MKDQVVTTYFIRIKLCERHPHISGLHKSKYCVMPDPFPEEQFGKGLGYARLTFAMDPKLGNSYRCIMLVIAIRLPSPLLVALLEPLKCVTAFTLMMT